MTVQNTYWKALPFTGCHPWPLRSDILYSAYDLHLCLHMIKDYAYGLVTSFRTRDQMLCQDRPSMIETCSRIANSAFLYLFTNFRATRTALERRHNHTPLEIFYCREFSAAQRSSHITFGCNDTAD